MVWVVGKALIEVLFVFVVLFFWAVYGVVLRVFGEFSFFVDRR